MLEAYDADPRWAPLQVTHEAVALAQQLLHGWQVQQAVTQGCLTQWQQTLETLETVESREMLGIMPPQASPQPQCPCPDTSA